MRYQRLCGVCGLWMLIAGPLFGHAAEPAPQPRAPNIVFILADDLGYGDLGCYGQQRIQTPYLDRMAQEGMRFTNFYAGSTVCAPSRCVLMTGLHTGHCRIRGNSKDNLLPEDVTIAEVLKSAGYVTGLMGKWGLGHEGSQGIPTRQGFDEFFGYLDQTHAHNFYPTFLIRNEQRQRLKNMVPQEGKFGEGVASEKVEYSHDLIVREALTFIDHHHSRPFFLYLALTLPHANNEAGKQGMEIPDAAPYQDQDWPEQERRMAAMVTRLDRDVGAVFEKLKLHGIDEQTIVFFSSDNGPHKEGGHDAAFFDSNGPLSGTKRDLTDGGIRVPFIVRWPGKIQPGRVSAHIGYFPDILPTLSELAGTTPPKHLDGISLVPTLLDQGTQAQHPALYWEFYEQGSARAVRMGQWKGICKPFRGQLRLYDITQDIAEQHDVAGQHPDVVKQILATMDAAHVPSPLWKLPQPKPPKND